MSQMKDLQARQEDLRNSLVVGWICALLLILTMFVVSLVKAAIATDFSRFAKDPGNIGLNMMIIIFAIHAVIPVALRVFNGVVFRWTMVGVGIFFFLMFLAHELTHMFVDKMPMNIYHTLDWTHHGLMLWIIAMNILWARAAAPGTARAGNDVPLTANLAVNAK